jgi:hypothetical protein
LSSHGEEIALAQFFTLEEKHSCTASTEAMDNNGTYLIGPKRVIDV